jgi:hypothetical protein
VIGGPKTIKGDVYIIGEQHIVPVGQTKFPFEVVDVI